MMESAENRSRDDTHVLGEFMADDRGGRQPGRWLREARTEAGVRAAAVTRRLPGANNPAQVLVSEGNQEVQALST